MCNEFQYDVFLSHSSTDKNIVRTVAEQLRKDGLKVWFDEWDIKPGDSIPAKIEEGLELSRVLVLCMSANAFNSDWAQLESNTFRFRDPLNKERRFIPLRLDETPIKGSLAQFQYINWLPETYEQEYPKLFKACSPPAQAARLTEAQKQYKVAVLSLGHTDIVRSVAFSPDGSRVLSGSADKTLRLWDIRVGCCQHVFEGHSDSVLSVTFSPDGSRVLSGSWDSTVRLWDINTGTCLQVLKGHSACVNSVPFCSDDCHALSGADDKTLRLWDINTGTCQRVLEGHSNSILSVAFSPDGSRALTGSRDNTVRLWDLNSGICLKVLEGHSDCVNSVAFSPNDGHVLSGSDDNTLRLWDINTGTCLQVLEGHSNSVYSVAFSPDGKRALSGADDNTLRFWDIHTGTCIQVLEGHSDSVNSVTFSFDGSRALSGADDNTLRIWDLNSGTCLQVLKGHSNDVFSLAFSSDGPLALSGSWDKTLRLWDLNTGTCLQVLEGHSKSVNCVAFSFDGSRALSGADDKTVRLWDINTGTCLQTLEGHSNRVYSVAFSFDGSCVLSGATDNTVRLWDINTGRCLRVFEGHSHGVTSVALSADGSCALSGAIDNTLRLWDINTGRCLRVFEGHTSSVYSVTFSLDGSYALSGSGDKTLRLWDINTGRCLHIFEGHTQSVMKVAFSSDNAYIFSGAIDGVMFVWETGVGQGGKYIPLLESFFTPTAIEQIQYTNAKVLLVGESGVGKTGLSKRLALNEWHPSDSTVGAWATQWKLPVSSGDGVEREIWLWDFGGQADQRLIHQLYMDETALAILVFDGQKEDLFETLGQWDRDLNRASRKKFTKLLVAGRVDAGGLRVSRSQIETFKKERDYLDFLETSAKTNLRCEELKQAILEGIRWEDIPWYSSPLLFKRLKDEIIKLRDSGRVLLRFNELRETLQMRLSGELPRFTDDELKAVVSLLAGPGVVWELKFGSWVLLQPEYINSYAQAVIQTIRADEDECGHIAEERVLRGDLIYHRPKERLPSDEERFALFAMHQTLVERSLCLREQTDIGPFLIFPSFYRRERPDLVGHPAVLVSYQFNGFLDDIYATLVVQLLHTKSFEKDMLWRYAADFKTLTAKQLGVKLTRRAEGAGEMEVYFDPAIPVEEKIIFSRYVHEHLLQKGQDVVRLRHFVCQHCGTPVGNREVAMKRLAEWLKNCPTELGLAGKIQATYEKHEPPTILCANCEERILLWDELEQYFASDEVKVLVRQLQAASDLVLDNESKDRALVGEVISTVALAGQIIEEYSAKRFGLDMEIEFKDDDGRPTARKLYLQLKSGDSHLRKRKTDDAKIFYIHHEDHAIYWMNQAYPVFLVIADSKGEVRWMEIRDYLRRESDNGKKQVKQIVFEGERFDVMSVRRWRDRILSL